jgi:hypothetical protein
VSKARWPSRVTGREGCHDFSADSKGRIESAVAIVACENEERVAADRAGGSSGDDFPPFLKDDARGRRERRTEVRDSDPASPNRASKVPAGGFRVMR